MVIEALKTARDFIESNRQDLAESLIVNGEIVFEDDIDLNAMAEYLRVLVVIDGAIEQALAAPVQPVDFETWFSSEERFNDAPIQQAHQHQTIDDQRIQFQQTNQ